MTGNGREWKLGTYCSDEIFNCGILIFLWYQRKEEDLALAVDIDRLLKGGVVEWQHIDFRKSFHPLPVLRNICAFANDINDHGGGYIIIGVEPDEHHMPIFPVHGLSPGEITIIKQEIFRACRHMQPPYYPIIEDVELKNKKKILVLWIPTGANRPYKVPRGLTKPQGHSYYIRSKTFSTRRATPPEELELIALANQIPFDDQIHHVADITDLNIVLIEEYLAAVKSGLAEQSQDMTFIDLCKSMNIAADIGELVKPKNIGLLLFSNHPEKFFPGAFIELTEFDGVGKYKEKIFTGPLAYQIDAVLTYIKGMVISKMGEEFPKNGVGPSECFNYPLKAVEEGLINAVYHKLYKENTPVEIRIKPKGMEIISWPGPMAPLDKQKLKLGDVSLRRLRNPGLGHFLKQMGLVQGKGTGLEKIRFLMENNGNPAPVFETDKKRRFFRIFLPIHPKFAPQEPVLEIQPKPLKGINEIVLRLSQDCPKDVDVKNAALLLLAAQEPVSLEDLMFKLNQTNKSRFRKSFIKPLMSLGWIEYTLPHKPTSEKQKYVITEQGRGISEKNTVLLDNK